MIKMISRDQKSPILHGDLLYLRSVKGNGYNSQVCVNNRH